MAEYKITGIKSLSMVDKEGNPVKVDGFDEPIEKHTDINRPIIDLLKETSPAYELMELELFKKYGHWTGSSIYEFWEWIDLEKATELELWRMYGMIKALDNDYYRNSYENVKYVFNQYRMKYEGEDIQYAKFKVEEFNIPTLVDDSKITGGIGFVDSK